MVKTRVESKDNLIDAAMTVFSQKGFEGASTREIALAAQVNHAAIAYYFSGKEALYAACLDAIVERKRLEMGGMAARLGESVRGGKLAEGECWLLLDLFIDTMVQSFLSCHEDVVRSRIVMRELIDPTPAFDRLYDGMMRDLHESITSLVARLTGMRANGRKAMICAQAIFGQISIFLTARAIMERRLKIEAYSEKDMRDIVAIIKTNTRGIIAAWRKNKD